MPLGPKSSSELGCAATSTTLAAYIRYRIDFKLAKLAFLARSSSTSLYLNSSVARYLPSRTLHSQDTNLLAVPRTKTVFGSRAFRVAAPTVFYSLPQDNISLTISLRFAAF